MDAVLRRRRWIVHRKLDGWKVSEIAFALQISEKTVDRWWRVYRKCRWEGLAVKSRRPHSFWRTPQGTVDLIIKLRREKRWGPCKIEGYLHNYGGEDAVTVGHNTIHRILIKAGLNSPIEAPRKVWGKRRFQRARSNELW